MMIAPMKSAMGRLRFEFLISALIAVAIIQPSYANTVLQMADDMGLGKTLACFLAVPLMLWCNWFLGMSMLFTVVTTVYLSFAFIYTYITHRDINNTDLMNDDLVGVGEKVAKLKRHYSSWVLYGIPFVLCWFAWFFYELKNAGLPSENMDAALNGVLIGGTIGLIMGVMRYRKVQRVANDVLQQIREMKEDIK